MSVTVEIGWHAQFNAATGVSIDPRALVISSSKFALFESVRLVSATGGVTLAPLALNSTSFPLASAAWIPQAATDANAAIHVAPSQVYVYQSAGQASSRTVPLDLLMFGTELKAAVLGNNTPKFVVMPSADLGNAQAWVTCKLVCTGHGFPE